MSKIYIGYVQGVHGLRGDLKIKNRFENPDKVFKVNNKIYLNEEEHTITACKFYKGFYLVTIDNIKHINLVEKYKGFDVFFNKTDLNLEAGEYILDDLYNLDIVCNNQNYGKVKEILDNGIYKILVVSNQKQLMIPLIDKYVKKVDLENEKIECMDIEGLVIWE